jgi:hypothetical protein
MNEFVANACSSTTNPDLGVRGAGHDSVIAWNIWQIIYPMRWFKENCGGVLPREMNALLTHDLAKARYAFGDGKTPASSAQKAVDGNANTAWIPSGEKTAIIDLNEYCAVETINVYANGNVTGYVSYSADGVSYSLETALTFNGNVGSVNISADSTVKFVKVRMEGETPVERIEVLGAPIFYDTLSYSASVVEDANTNFTACLDRHNYSTSWEGGKSSSSIEAVIDLGEEKEIFQTAIKPLSICKLAYKIEISSNGEDWREYAVDSGATAKFVFVNSAYAKARYVKLALLSSSEGAFVISDFKVQGR